MELWTTLWLAAVVSACWEGQTTSAASANAWALDNCHSGNIDLVLVADASVVSTYDMKQIRQRQDKQMLFFSSLVDIFTPPTDETLTSRVRVYLLFASEDASGAPMIQERRHVGMHTDKVKLKQAMLNEVIPFKDNSNPMGAIQYLKKMYSNETEEIRDNTTVVIIMFGGHQNMNESYTERDLRSDLNISDQSITVKLFMFVLKNVPPDRLMLTSNVAIYKISDIHDDLYKRAAILMCKYCFCEWFGENNDPPAFSKTVDTISCYKLGSSINKISWIEANELCRLDHSQLISIETEEELTSVRKSLQSHIEKLRMADNSTDYIAIYIGLRRLRSTVGRRFRWINNNPLVYTQWGHAEPRGGSIRGCVKWELSNISYSLNTDEELRKNNELLSSAMKGAWSAVGCGYAVTKYYLCENAINFPLTSHAQIAKKFNLKVPHDDSITGAIERGELGFRKDLNMLVSLSVLLQMWKSQRSLVSGYAYDNHSINATFPLSEIKLYHCEGNDGKIPYTSVCDFATDCPFALDEIICRKCNPQEKVCGASRQCIPEDSWCDLIPDCQDHSDEVNCDTCKHGLCEDGQCMVKHWFVDGEVDCSECDYGDNSYEMNYVQEHGLANCLFTCNRTECVYQGMLNDSVAHCQGPEGPIDETIGALESVSCHILPENRALGVSNWGPKCVYVKDIYGEIIGCRNMRHLQDCAEFTCPDGYYHCPLSYCIPTHYVRDDNMDCPHGEDENYDMQFVHCPFYFLCQVSNRPRNAFLCLHPDLVCDGRKDCPEGDDELNCNIHCVEGFRCLAGTMIAAEYKKSKTAEVIHLIDPLIRYLDLSGVNLSKDFPIFFRDGAISLIEVKMSNCNIIKTSMPVPTCNLGTIRRLDLSYNDITNISVNSVFRCMNNLHILNLSHNERLTSFQGIENEIVNLKFLDLSYTGLASLSSVTFSFLKDVKYLTLRQTRITDVRFLPPTTIDILDLRDTAVNNLPYADMFKHVIISLQLHTNSFKLCCPQLHNDSTNISACTSTKDPFSSCSDLMSNLALRIILWTDGVLAVLGNLAVIIYRLFFDRSIFSMAYGHFVTHLGISDFIMGVYLGMIAIADVYFRDVYIWEEIAWRKSAVCNIAGFLSTLSIEVSTMFIVLITIDRFLVIRYPFGQLRIAGRYVILCCCITWLVGLLLALFPLLPFFHYLNVYNTNGMCLGLPLANYEHSGKEFAIAVFIFLNFLMFALICGGQVIIYRTISTMRMSETSLTQSNFRRSQDLSVAKNLATVAITNFFFWAPVGVMGIMVQSGYAIDVVAYAWLAVLILPINSAINPLLYTVPTITRKLRQVKERMWSQRCK